MNDLHVISFSPLLRHIIILYYHNNDEAQPLKYEIVLNYMLY